MDTSRESVGDEDEVVLLAKRRLDHDWQLAH